MTIQDIMKEAGPVAFYKMQGSGNDFVLLLNDELQVPRQYMTSWAQKICHRYLGVGADGLIFLESTNDGLKVDYRWHFFNSDGSRAEMCGNGSRCAAWLAHRLGLADHDHVLGTDAGPVQASVAQDQNLVKVLLTSPKDLALNIALMLSDQRSLQVHFVNTGVPHIVYFTENPEQLSIEDLGPKIRYHAKFAPKGVNVNLVALTGENQLYVRTYERGVEAETLACGTGAAAAAVIAQALGLCTQQANIKTSGKENLSVFIEQDQVYLQGPAELVFTGYLNSKAMQLEGYLT